MENNLFKDIDQKMGKTIDALKKDFVSIQAGRANPNILDNIFVDYYGSSMPINQLALIILFSISFAAAFSQVTITNN